jgi:CRP/FNR family cyclic AMP-dependent transcriptional regulator
MADCFLNMSEEQNHPAGWQPLLPQLPSVGILAGLSEKSLENLAAYGTYQNAVADEEIITEGQLQDKLYVVVQGRLRISAKVSSTEITLSEVEAGECIGEVSLLEPGPASATVRVVDASVLWHLQGSSLQQYLQKHAGGGGALMMGIAACLSQRLRAANQAIGQHHLTPTFVIPPQHRQEPIRTDASETKGLFGLFKKKPQEEKKVKISTEIKI